MIKNIWNSNGITGHAIAALLIVVGSVLAAHAVCPISQWSTSIPYGDASILAYILGWAGHALATSPLDYYNIPVGYPKPMVLAGMDGMIFQAVLLSPVWFLTHSVTMLYNVAVLFSFLFGGLAAYIAAFLLLRSRSAALAVAAMFTITTDRYFHVIGHLNLIYTGFLPLVFAFVYLALERPGRKWMIAAAGTLGFSIFASNYIFVLSALTLAAAVFCFVLAHGLAASMKQAKRILLIVGFGLIIALPVAFIHLYAKQSVETNRTSIATAENYDASIAGWLMPPNRPNTVVSKYASPLEIPVEQHHRGENCQFIGILIVFGLLLEGLRLTYKAVNKKWDSYDSLSAGLIGVGLFLLICSFGPRIQIGDRNIPGPYMILHTFILQFTGFFRIPSRLAFITEWLFALSIGIGFVRYLQLYSRCRPIACAVIILVTWFEHVPRTSILVYTPQKSAVVKTLDKLESSGKESLLILPDPASLGPVAFSTMHNWRPLANAWPDNPLLDDYLWFFDVMSNLDNQRSIAVAARREVRWLITVNDETLKKAQASSYLEQKDLADGQGLFLINNPEQIIKDQQKNRSTRQKYIDTVRAETTSSQQFELNPGLGNLKPMGGYVTEVLTEGGSLVLKPQNPGMVSFNISFPPDFVPAVYDEIEVTYQLPVFSDHEATLYWSAPGIPVTERTHIMGKISGNGPIYTAKINLSQHPDWLWQDMISSLRFDISNNIRGAMKPVLINSVRFARHADAPAVHF